MARHADPGGGVRDATLICPYGENPTVAPVSRVPWLGDKLRRKDGQNRAYHSDDGGVWKLAPGENVTVIEIGANKGSKPGLRVKNTEGKITRDYLPTSSWEHSIDAAPVLQPILRGVVCSGCGKIMQGYAGQPVNCEPCKQPTMVPGDRPKREQEITPRGRWPASLKVPAGVSVLNVKQLVETAKGIAQRHQVIKLRRGGATEALRDDAKVEPGAALELEVKQPPLSALNERLSRVDSAGIRLASEVRAAPWDDGGRYEKHCMQADSEPGLLGRGGFASVYRCRRRGAPFDTPDLFAVKQIQKSRICDTHSQVRQVLVEICCSHSLPRHNNLIHVDEVLHSESTLYYIMPLTHGVELYSLIQKPAVQQQMLKQDICSRMMRQLLSALQHMHRRGLAHRDVKPENMLCDADNGFHLTLIDLGLTRFCGDTAHVAHSVGGLAGLPSTTQLQGPATAAAGEEVDCGEVEDDDDGATQKHTAAYQAMLDVMPTPYAMTVAYASAEAIRSALLQEERKRRQLPSMDIYGAGATLFACLVRMVPFLRQREMAALPSREWMTKMAERAKAGIEKERGWDKVQGALDADGQTFLKRLMDPDLERRHTAIAALQDPWLCKHCPHDISTPMKTPMPDAAHFRMAEVAVRDVSEDEDDEHAAHPDPGPAQPAQPGTGASPRARGGARGAVRRAAEDHMHAGTEGLAAQQQGELLALVPGVGRADLDRGA